MQAMKAMKRVSIIAKNKRANVAVFHGHKTNTVGRALYAKTKSFYSK